MKGGEFMKDIKNTKALEKIMQEFYENGFVITAIVYSPNIEDDKEKKMAIITEEDAKMFFK